jgi:radical SAM protein with 4Fe4S-binding SPASM domain
MMRENPFTPLYQKCNAGDSRQKLASLPAFPHIIDIELTNLCNFRCLMCPTGNHSQRRAQGFMPEDVYYKILDDIRGHCVGLRFIRWGEPLMHPKVIEFFKAAKSDGHLIHMNTNGSLLTREMAENLLAVPIDSLKFSVQGVTAESYREMRNTDFFEQLLKTSKMLHDMRGGRPLPFLQISTTVTYESEEQQEQFRERVSHICDATNIGATNFDWLDVSAVRLSQPEIDTLKRLMQFDSLDRVHPECPEVFDKLSIDWNGKVSACCMDSDNLMTVGDVRNSTIDEIWRSDSFDHYRRMLADMRHDDLPLCKNCWDTHRLFVPTGDES